MKASLTFNLPEDDSQFEDALNATKYSCALHEISSSLRSLRKYSIPEEIKTREDMLEHIHSIYLAACSDLPSIP